MADEAGHWPEHTPALRRSRIAERVRRRISALQPDLMRAIAIFGWQEEVRIGLHPTIRLHVALHHPAFDAGGIELTVPSAVESVGEVDTPPIAAHLNHLRPPVDRPRGR